MILSTWIVPGLLSLFLALAARPARSHYANAQQPLLSVNSFQSEAQVSSSQYAVFVSFKHDYSELRDILIENLAVIEACCPSWNAQIPQSA
jgi:hypothetical protein